MPRHPSDRAHSGRRSLTRQHGSGPHAQTQPGFRQTSSFRKFSGRATARSTPERARAPRLARWPRGVGCLRAWYVSNVLWRGDSNKIVPQTIRHRLHPPLAATAMCALHACMHGRVKLIDTGGGEQFFCVLHVCFDLGKLFPRLQGGGGSQS